MKAIFKIHNILLFLVFVLFFSILVFFEVNKISDANTLKITLDFSLTGKVTKVVDGDTFYFKPIFGKETKVRMLGIDAPESVSPDPSKNSAFGKKVSEYVNEKLTGKKVSLVLDKNIYDAYNRVLAYVHINQIDFNSKLLKIGYAKTYFQGANIKNKDKYQKVEKVSMKNKKGIWSLITFKTNPNQFPYSSSLKGSKFHTIDCSYRKRIVKENLIFLKNIDTCKIFSLTPCKSCVE